MAKVLIVATSRKTRGGITSVLKAHETGEQWKRFHCHWVQTHRDTSNVVKLGYFFTGFIDYLLRLPFYDIVYLHISRPTTIRRKRLFLELAKMLGKKIIVHFHVDVKSIVEGEHTKEYKHFINYSDYTIVLSKIWKEMLVDKFKVDENKIKVLYNPCLNGMKFDGFGEKKEEKYILDAGTISVGKGYIDLIKAFALIHDKYPEWQVVFAGNGEIEEARQLAKDLGIEDKIKFVGWVSGNNKDRIFREASAFCLPSYSEGFPMAVLDAWSYGLPVITTPVGGIPDVAVDGENLLLFEPGDIEMLSKQLERIISDQELRKKLSLASIDFASKEFFIDNFNRQLGEIYESLSK